MVPEMVGQEVRRQGLDKDPIMIPDEMLPRILRDEDPTVLDLLEV